jgi:hypothetical protein
MELKETQALIKKFRDYVVSQSRANLTRQRKNFTNSLYKSIKGEIVTEDRYTIVGFIMDEHGAYQDKGVRGARSDIRAPKSPFKFGSGTGKKGGLSNGIEKWVKVKQIQFRNKENGKFLSYQSTAYIIARSIFNKGLKPSLFFTKPFEKGYKKYISTDLIKAFSIDVDTIVDYNLKKK